MKLIENGKIVSSVIYGNDLDATDENAISEYCLFLRKCTNRDQPAYARINCLRLRERNADPVNAERTEWLHRSVRRIERGDIYHERNRSKKIAFSGKDAA